MFEKGPTCTGRIGEFQSSDLVSTTLLRHPLALICLGSLSDEEEDVRPEQPVRDERVEVTELSRAGG